jgi:hypothetical protein
MFRFYSLPWELVALLDACGNDAVSDPAFWFAADGYSESLALCAIDSIFATGQQYHFVVKLIGDFREYRRRHGGNARQEGTRELLATFDQLGGSHPWAVQFAGQRQISAHEGTPQRAEAVRRIAQGFAELGVWTMDDLRQRATDGTLADVEQLWRSILGQRSGPTWKYFLMLASVPPADGGIGSVTTSADSTSGSSAARVVIDSDCLINQYVSRVLGRREASLEHDKVAVLMAIAAWWRAWELDHLYRVMWRFESNRTAIG